MLICLTQSIVLFKAKYSHLKENINHQYIMKKIVFFIPNGTGGAEKVSSIFAKILHKSNYLVKVIIVKPHQDKRDNITSFIKDLPIDFLYCKKAIYSLPQIIKILKREKPDFVFSSLTNISLLLIIASTLFPKIKVIARQCFTPGTESLITESIITFFFRFAHINIAQTEEMKELMIKKYYLPKKKVICINNPIDEEDIRNKIQNVSPSTGVSYRYVAVGRVARQKDYLTMLKAFKIVNQQFPDSTLTIIGSKNREEDYYNTIIKYIQENNLTNNIFFIEYTNNPFEIIQQSDCFVLSSITEGLPNVLLEAMFLNIPVVATRCIPFIQQQIIEGVNGYTVNIEDHTMLAQSMIKGVSLKGTISNKNYNEEITKQIINLFKNI